MNLREDIRTRIEQNLDAMSRGSRKNPADFFGLTPLQKTRMLNTAPGQETRVIRADEFEKIKMFFGGALFVPDCDIMLPEKSDPADLKKDRLVKLWQCSLPERAGGAARFFQPEFAAA
ncbi:hypothetical protein [Candidatus Tokpelaia sp.]|uniref:hypothetical protein n=1 Tax=Candidatus Tokpelaia sp. TaxID=2233777 RepID=UPI00123BD5F7|nr:hypothetical protein [Candidatus Tokpelaia sp.]KAA6405348.1 hypothetical protein DPQ22_04590 [Candidatus Tokpelaia sp.]